MDYLSLLQRPFYETKYNPATKGLSTSPLDDFWYQDAKHDDDTDPASLFRAVPWLYRGVQLRANAVAAMPFVVMRGETEIDSSDDYKNVLGWLPNPRRLFYMTEAALCCFGAGYWWNERNRVATKAVRYVVPSTVEPVIEADGLKAFIRSANGRRVQVPPETLTYFWHPDPWVELGPPLSSPVMAAIAASGVLYNLNQFSAAYFKRGAIKATLLTVQGAPVAQERDRLKTWWRQLVSGVKNAWTTEIVNADAVTPVVIGEGLAELANAELTAEKRQDIAQALGIPQAVMFSESAKGLGGAGVANADERRFYADTVIPDCIAIADAVNEQKLAAQGLRLVFRPETLDVFQEDEAARATAFSAYVSAGLPIDLVAEMLGLELPASWSYDDLRKRREENEAQAKEQFGMEQAQQPPDDPDDDPDDEAQAKTLADLRAWRRKSSKRGRLADFISDHIPAAVMDDVKAHSANGWRDALDGVIAAYEFFSEPDTANSAKNAMGGVIAVYEGEDAQPEPAAKAAPIPDTTELVAALRSATEALLHGQPE